MKPWWQRALEHPAKSHRVSIGHADINYRSWEPDDASRPLLLFAHGYRGHARWWDWIAPHFTDRFRVVAIDFSGMGDSAWRPSYNGVTFRQDILGLIAYLRPTSVTGIGHSFGGMCLLRACAHEPEAVDQAIIIDSWMRLPGDEVPKSFQIGRSVTYPDYAAARARYRLIPEQPVAHQELLEHIAQLSMRQHDDGWRWKFDPALPLAPNDIEAVPLLRGLSTKVDYVYGELSALIDDRRAQRIVEELPHGRGPIKIPQARHHLMLDQPLALISALRSLLEKRRGN